MRRHASMIRKVHPSSSLRGCGPSRCDTNTSPDVPEPSEDEVSQVQLAVKEIRVACVPETESDRDQSMCPRFSLSTGRVLGFVDWRCFTGEILGPVCGLERVLRTHHRVIYKVLLPY